MNAKKSVIFVMVLVSMIYLVQGAVFEVTNDYGKMKITMINQEPDPVSAGEKVDLRFRVENLKDEPLQNVEVKIVPKYPLSLYGGSSEVQNLGTLTAGDEDHVGVRVKYELRVDDDAAIGNAEVEMWYRSENGVWVKAGDYNVEIKERDAVLAINEVTTDSDRILPGEEVFVTFNLENLAESTLKDIKLSLTLLTEVVTTTGISQTELPFTPIGSGNEKTVKSIEAGKSKGIGYTLFVDADAQSKVYKVPYALSYSDERGNNFSRSGIVGLIVDAEPRISINIDENSVTGAGSQGTVTIKFVNKGFSDIKFLDLKMDETNEIEIISNPDVYIGNVDSDDYETADFDIYVSEKASGKTVLPLNVEYRDSNGKLYSITENLEMDLLSDAEIRARSNSSGNIWVGLLIVAVIVVAGVLLWKRFKRRQKH